MTGTNEAAVQSPTRRFWRTAIVVALSAYVLGLTLPNLLLTTEGTLLRPCVRADFTVRCVVPGTPEASSGLEIGDRIVPSSLSLVGRIGFLNTYFFRNGERFTFTVIRQGSPLSISMLIDVPAGANTFGLTLIKRGSATVFVIIAGALLLLRPSRMTWGFFLYAIGSINGSALYYRFLPAPAYTALVESLVLVVATCTVTGLWMFGSRFPDEEAVGWRSAIGRAAPIAGIALGVANVAARQAFVDGIALSPLVLKVIGICFTTAIVTGLAGLVGGYINTSADRRQRLKWVVAGFAVYIVANAYANVISPNLPDGGWPAAWTAAGWTVDVLAGLQIAIPLTVAYAILKHHVLDVNFVFSRAVVYGVLTTIIVGIFVAAEWLIGHVLDLQRVASVVNLGIAIGFGFGLNGMHRRVDDLVDRVIFRKRHLAESRLERVGAGIAHAASDDAVSTALVDEPAHAFDLTSAAVFRRRDDGCFSRAASFGWPDGAAASLPSDDRIVLHMQGERGPMRLDDIIRRQADLPQGANAPIVAFPLIVRHQLEGLVLFGPHVTGEDIDPDETRTLARLTASAAAAYDHIAAEAARRQAVALAAELRDAQTRLQAMQAALGRRS
jgi:hypothetical protein